jgi:hypothetical protein
MKLQHDFYSAAAQVFPLLLVALFVEVAARISGIREEAVNAHRGKAYSKEKEEEEYRRVAQEQSRAFKLGLGVVGAIVIGEAATLWALADRPTRGVGALVVACLFFAGGALLFIFVQRVSRLF